MDITDAEMIAAADRGERLYRARKAQSAFRARYARATPMLRAPYRPRIAPAYAARAPYRPRMGSTAPEINSLDTDILPVADVFNMTSAVAGAEPAVFTGITEVNLVRQGPTFYQRIGNKIHMRSLSITFTPAVATSNGVINLRYMVVYDKQPNGAFPALTDVLQINDTGNVVFHSSMNIANRSRFSILRDKFMTFSTIERSSAIVKDYIKLYHDTEFKANGGTIGDIATGALFFIAFVDWYDGSNKLSCSPQSAFGSILARLRYDA